MRASKKNMKVEIQNLPSMTVAYIRHIGPYKGDSKLFESLFETLCKWAGPRNLINEKTIFLSVYYDDPEITEERKLRFDLCMTVPEDTKVEGQIGKMKLESGKFAVARFELKNPSEYGKAWDALYRDWLPQSGYQPADLPCYEIYRNDPKNDPDGKHIVDLCVPVKPL